MNNVNTPYSKCPYSIHACFRKDDMKRSQLDSGLVRLIYMLICLKRVTSRYHTQQCNLATSRRALIFLAITRIELYAEYLLLIATSLSCGLKLREHACSYIASKK